MHFEILGYNHNDQVSIEAKADTYEEAVRLEEAIIACRAKAQLPPLCWYSILEVNPPRTYQDLINEEIYRQIGGI